VEARRDLPIPSYVLHSSPNHIHVFWRVTGFDNDLVERLPHLVTVEYRNVDVTYGPEHFPPVKEAVAWSQSVRLHEPLNIDVPAIERAKRYLTSVPPAIAGQHGDVHTFRVCCRLVRGFALDEDQALHVLWEWGTRAAIRRGRPPSSSRSFIVPPGMDASQLAGC
jgi:hypothetical protein